MRVDVDDGIILVWGVFALRDLMGCSNWNT